MKYKYYLRDTKSLRKLEIFTVIEKNLKNVSDRKLPI
jgi:hypothetical protein